MTIIEADNVGKDCLIMRHSKLLQDIQNMCCGSYSLILKTLLSGQSNLLASSAFSFITKVSSDKSIVASVTAQSPDKHK